MTLGKPMGLQAIESAREKAERPAPTPPPREERPDDIIGILRTTKDGKRHMVKLRNGKWSWVNAPLPQDRLFLDTSSTLRSPTRGAASAPEAPPIASGPVAPGVDRDSFLRPEKGTVYESEPTRHTPLDLIKVAGGVMSEREAKQLHEDYFNAMVELVDMLDKLIDATTRNPHPTVVIWSDLDDKQIETMVASIFALAQRHSAVAVVVRQTVNFYRQGKLIMILAPRFWKTYQHYAFYGFELPGNQQWRKRVIQASRNGQRP